MIQWIRDLIFELRDDPMYERSAIVFFCLLLVILVVTTCSGSKQVKLLQSGRTLDCSSVEETEHGYRVYDCEDGKEYFTHETVIK